MASEWALTARSGAGRPLPMGLRQELESRFRTDLGRVRIHEGAGAAFACRCMRARACAVGYDILFELGNYAPDTVRGRWLLAHELVHVLQQTGGNEPVQRPLRIGDPDDPHEIEANCIADQFVAAKPLSRISRDRSREIRRAVSIDMSSAKLTIDSAGTAAAVGIGKVRAACHLTRGFVSADANLEDIGDAFKFNGEVDLFVDTRAEADTVRDRWTFNFIQAAKINVSSFTHEGRSRTEGEVFTILSAPPAFPANQPFTLDCPRRSMPFVNRIAPALLIFRPNNNNKIRINVKQSMGDHPCFAAGLTAPNSVTKSLNFLFKIVDDTEFVSVFVARDDQGVFQPPIAHVTWRVQVEARFKWRRNRATGGLKSGGITFGAPTQGGPADSAVQAILANPGPPRLRELTDQAIKNSHNILNKQESENRALLIPKDFFL